MFFRSIIIPYKTILRIVFFIVSTCTLPLFQQIPAAFIKNFDGEVPRQAVLWSPARECWHVNVEKSNERLFFEEGWGLFLKENGLEFGDLLVFHYAGKSEFGVEFYGRSCCQKRVVTASSRKGSMPLNVHSENQNKMKREREQSEKRYHDNDRNNECRNKNLDDLSLKVPSDEIIASQKKVRIEVIDLETDDSEPSEQYSTEENELFEENSQTRKGRIILVS